MRFTALTAPRAGVLFAFAAAGALAAGCGSPAPEVAVTMTDFAYDPSRITIQRATKTVLKIENKGATEHNLAVQQINVSSGPVAPGRTVRVEITAPRGPLKVVCTIPGHEAMGMVGEIAVEARR